MVMRQQGARTRAGDQIATLSRAQHDQKPSSLSSSVHWYPDISAHPSGLASTVPACRRFCPPIEIRPTPPGHHLHPQFPLFPARSRSIRSAPLPLTRRL
ncbi:hypothetical protein FA13DRAFT_1177516 [Coprinellus micaceus]|uniref:Uncharacterized protein n=1 Tax=Coprinellus micaceus TaxID=71717 RepID=A0A4Y7STX2_COPMI|nr:hypothetical protein FA13DRAFT_1177516 [Coprinellus micaceus]